MKVSTWICLALITLVLPVEGKFRLRCLTNDTTPIQDEVYVWGYGDEAEEDVQDIPRE
jgi:hypothetical protein